MAQPLAGPLPPARLVVGLDGGWVPSRDQTGGMEGKISVVATRREPINTSQDHYRLAPRRCAATFGTAEQVGTLTYAPAHALGGEEAKEQVVLGDGTERIKTQAAWHFPASRTILDWPHAARAMHKAIHAERPRPRQRAVRKELHQRLGELLWTGQVADAR